MRSVGDSKFALEYLVDFQQRFPSDPGLVDRVISLYQANNDQERAYEIGVSRLSLEPNNPEQIRQQIDRALAAGKIYPALIYAQRLVKIDPVDDKAHETTAKIAEWAGKPKLALIHWLWLARNRKDEASIANTIRLSKQLYFGNVTMEMLIQLSNTRNLTNDEISSLLTAFNETGDLNSHLSFLDSYLQRDSDNIQAWKALAKTQENAGRLSLAMATWQHIGSYFDRPLEAVIHQAQLMWKNHQAEKAFDLLLKHHEQVTNEEMHFWEFFGELSWHLERHDYALIAYNSLWDSDAADVLVAERLIQLMRDLDKPEKSIDISIVAYSHFNQPRWLLLAMDVANQIGSLAELKRLMKIASSNEQEFQDSEMYWLLRAQLDVSQNKPEIAVKHYQQALIVNPASISAKAGILWILIDQNDKESLQSYTKAWNQDAFENASLWGAYGLALAKIGQNQAALPWLKRQSQVSSNDYLWSLTYADILNKAGHADKSWRLRKHVLVNLRSHFNKAEKFSDKDIKKFLYPQYLALVREMKGGNTEAHILRNFLEKGYSDPDVRELLVAAYLSQENYSAARYWMLKNHIDRLKTPAWQRLTLALKENNVATVEHILENESDNLTKFNKIEVLKHLNRDKEALALTYELLDSHNGQSSLQIPLYNSRDELVAKLSRQIAGAIDYKSFGGINFTESQVRLSAPYLRGRLATELKHTLLDSSRSDITLPVENEVDILTKFEQPLRDGKFHANLGGNFRSDESLAYGAVKFSQSVTNNMHASLRLGVNEISYESGALRSLGAKDTILLSLSSQLTRQTHLQFDIDGHRYLTRQGSTLGKGYKMQGILGSSLLTGAQDWQVRLQGTWESNDLKQNLPSELKGLFGPSASSVETLILPNFGTLGMGTTFRYGPHDQGILRRPFIHGDVWAGWVWPANVVGYNSRAAMGISLFGSDILSVGGFYSNVQGGRAGQAFSGVNFQYSVGF